MKILFAILFGVCSLAHLYACVPPAHPMIRKITKPALMPLLLCCYYFAGPAAEWTVVAALALCFVGDVLLLFYNRALLFKLGMLAFGAAHVLYSVFFLSNAGGRPSFLFLAITVVVYAACIGLSIYLNAPRLTEDLLLPACAYTVVIAFMSMSALCYAVTNAGVAPKVVFAGTVLFLVSDAVRARSVGKRGTRTSNLIVMLAYLIAQACIIFGIAANGGV